MEEDKGAAASVTSASSSSSSDKQQEKRRKKNPKSWENVMKNISSMDEAGKLAYIEEKYKTMFEEVRKLNMNNQQLTKQLTVIQKERDLNQSELAKSIVARARLENLCRELQKQNKQIKEENMAKIKEEEERRKEASSKFADKLSDINTLMDENKEKSERLRLENLKMSSKLADLYTKFHKREEDIAKMTQQLELEKQLSQATLAKMELELKAEKEMHTQEQTIMRSNLEKSEANCAVLLKTVKDLQDHIDIYKHQYEGFESTMSKSTKVFDNFKQEVAQMSKQVASLEQEAQSWKNKFNDSMKALVEMTELKKNQDLYLQCCDRKIDQLNKLCRQLQVDRSNYLKLLKTHGIEPTSSVPDKSADDESNVKLTGKEKELHLLKQNLKVVKDQLAKLTMKETDDKTEKTIEDVEAKQLTETKTEPVPSQKDDKETVESVPKTEETVESNGKDAVVTNNSADSTNNEPSTNETGVVKI